MQTKALNLRAKNVRRLLPARTNAYTVPVQGHPGLYIGYKVNEFSRSWLAKRYVGTGKYEWFPNGIGKADDAATANGVDILSFDDAVNKAIEWADNAKELDGHGTPTNTRYTVKQCVLDYIADKQNEKRKELYRDTATANAHIIPALGDIELKELTHSRLKAWRDSLAKGDPRRGYAKGKRGRSRPKADQSSEAEAEYLRKRQSSANRVLTVLKAALNWSLQERRQFIKSDNAWKHVKPFKGVEVAKIRYLDDAELKAFMPAIEHEDFSKLVKGALFTGARYGELTRVRVEDFSEGQSSIFIDKSKNSEARHVFLNAEAVAWFKSITADRNTKERIFLHNGKTWGKSEQFRPMKAACEASKVKGVTFHILRHSYASHALMAKMPLEVLQKQLGHKSITITIKHYGHLSEAYRHAQVQSFAPSYNFEGAPTPTNSEAAPSQSTEAA
jgi:integrase